MVWSGNHANVSIYYIYMYVIYRLRVQGVSPFDVFCDVKQLFNNPFLEFRIFQRKSLDSGIVTLYDPAWLIWLLFFAFPRPLW